MLSIQDLTNENLRWMSDGVFGEDVCQRRRRCVKQLLSYLSYLGIESNVSVLQLIIPSFLTGFGEYLYEVKGKDKRLAIVEDWVDIFHRMVRDGIRYGFLPNNDPLIEIRRKFAEKYGASADKRKGGNYKASVHNYAEQLARAVSLVSSSVAQLRRSSEVPSPSSASVGSNKWGGGQPTEYQDVVKIKKIILYLFGLSCYGIEIEEIAQLRCSYAADDEYKMHPRVKHPRYGFDIELTGVQVSLWRLYNNIEDSEWPAEGELLFPEGCETSFAYSLETIFANNGIKLYRSRSILADLLGLVFARDYRCVPAPDVLSRIIDGAPDPKAEAWMRSLGRVDVDVDSRLYPRWRILCTYAPGLTPDRVEAKIQQLRDGLGLVQVYIPREEVIKEGKNGKRVKELKPVLGRYIFLQSTLGDASAIERSVTNVSFIRQMGDEKKMAVVRNEEIVFLQTMFRDFAADVDLMEHDQWVREQENYTVGQKVRIKNGSFAGITGYVYKIREGNNAKASGKTRSSQQPPGSGRIFVIDITDDIILRYNLECDRIQADCAGLELEPIA